MKVHRDTRGLRFRPFDITLTVESEEEARALYAVFNYSPNVDLLSFGACEPVRKAIGEKYSYLGADGADNVIARGITYGTFYRHKNRD